MSAALSLELKLNQIIEKEISGTDKPDTGLIEECSDALWRLSDSKKYAISYADYSGCVASLPGYRVRSKKKLGKTAKIILVAAIVAILSLLVAVGYGNKEYIIEVFDDHSILHTDKTNGKLESRLTVGYIPEGYELDSDIVSKYCEKIGYLNGEKVLTVSKEAFFENLYVDSEFGGPEEVVINGVTYIFTGNDEHGNIVVWNTGQYQYMIFGFVTREELIKIAESTN